MFAIDLLTLLQQKWEFSLPEAIDPWLELDDCSCVLFAKKDNSSCPSELQKCDPRRPELDSKQTKFIKTKPALPTKTVPSLYLQLEHAECVRYIRDSGRLTQTQTPSAPASLKPSKAASVMEAQYSLATNWLGISCCSNSRSFSLESVLGDNIGLMAALCSVHSRVWLPGLAGEEAVGFLFRGRFELLRLV